MYTSKVKQFTSACNDSLPKTPEFLDKTQVAFISKMVGDELTELAVAETVVDQADALVDAIYYICDSAVRHGINLDPIFAIVHGANMKKVVNGKVIRREDGKIMKPEGWKPADEELRAEVRRQYEEGSFNE